MSASRKKLSKSPHTPLSTVSSDSDDEIIEAGNKLVILEIDGVNETLKSFVACKECSGGPVVFMEDHASKDCVLSLHFIMSSVVPQHASPSQLCHLHTNF